MFDGNIRKFVKFSLKLTLSLNLFLLIYIYSSNFISNAIMLFVAEKWEKNLIMWKKSRLQIIDFWNIIKLKLSYRYLSISNV